MPTITQKITPFLWFHGNAEEAVAFYTSIFPDSRTLATSRYSDAGKEQHGQPPGSVMTIDFELCGQRFTALNGGGGSQSVFNQAVSFVVHCDTQAEIDRYWEKLTAQGGQPVVCGWLRDRFGLSWQIVPAIIWDLITNQATSPRVMQAVMSMVKLDLAALKAAAESK